MDGSIELKFFTAKKKISLYFVLMKMSKYTGFRKVKVQSKLNATTRYRFKLPDNRSLVPGFNCIQLPFNIFSSLTEGFLREKTYKPKDNLRWR